MLCCVVCSLCVYDFVPDTPEYTSLIRVHLSNKDMFYGPLIMSIRYASEHVF